MSFFADVLETKIKKSSKAKDQKWGDQRYPFWHIFMRSILPYSPLLSFKPWRAFWKSYKKKEAEENIHIYSDFGAFRVCLFFSFFNVFATKFMFREKKVGIIKRLIYSVIDKLIKMTTVNGLLQLWDLNYIVLHLFYFFTLYFLPCLPLRRLKPWLVVGHFHASSEREKSVLLFRVKRSDLLMY